MNIINYFYKLSEKEFLKLINREGEIYTLSSYNGEVTIKILEMEA